MSQAEDISIPLFVSKLFQMLQSNDHSDAVEWQPDRKGFRIKNIKHLENKVLPKYFRHGNYTSFVRQLNMYNFHKVKIDEDSVFAHSELTQLNKQLLTKIKRKCYKRYSDKENLPESTQIVRFEPTQHLEPIKPINIDGLIDQLVQSVREEVSLIGGEPKKIVYQMRKMPRFRPIKGSRHLFKIYTALHIEKQKHDDQLQQLSIEEVILYQDDILNVKSLAYLRSQAIFIKTQTEEQFDCS